MTKEKKDKTFLDSLKDTEEKIKKKAMSNALTEMKGYARDVLNLKFKMLKKLEQFGLDEKEIKGIIDWINSLPDVQLSEKDKKDIENEVKEEVVVEKKEAEDFINTLPDFNYYNGAVPMPIGGTTYTNTGTTLTNCSDGSITAT